MSREKKIARYWIRAALQWLSSDDFAVKYDLNRLVSGKTHTQIAISRLEWAIQVLKESE